MNSYEECQELKNIRYKTMLQSSNNNKLIVSELTKDLSNANLLLDNECNNNKKETWNKLDKSIKMDKINEYILSLTSKYKLNKLEIKNLREYLSSNLDKKNLYKNKEVTYIKESGKLENIHNLHFNNSTRKFTLRKNVQHVSTAKALGPTRKKNKSKSNKSKVLNSPRSESPKSECS